MIERLAADKLDEIAKTMTGRIMERKKESEGMSFMGFKDERDLSAAFFSSIISRRPIRIF